MGTMQIILVLFMIATLVVVVVGVIAMAVNGKLNKNHKEIELPENYIWLSQNQIIDLINKQKIDIEARLLFGIMNFRDTI